MENVQPTELLALRQQNIGRKFQRAARAYSELSLKKLRRYGHHDLTLFHTALISNLDVEGTRITTLAERAGISKQAMGQLVHELEQRNYIKRFPDPEDKRATLVKFTKLGWRFLQDAYQVKQAIEADYTALLGEQGMARLQALLQQLLEQDAGKGS